MNMNCKFMLDIEVYDPEYKRAQGKYLVHGYDDSFWTDSIDDALAFLKDQLKEL